MAKIKLRGLPTIAVSGVMIALFAILQSSLIAGIHVYLMLIALSIFWGVIFILNLRKISFYNNKNIFPVCVTLSVISLFVLPKPLNLASLLWLSPIFYFILTLPAYQWVPGIIVALVYNAFTYILPQYNVYLLSSFAIIISLITFFIRNNTGKAVDELFPALWPQKTLNIIFLFTEILLLLSCVFLMLLLPLYGNVYQTAGYLIGIVIMLVLRPALLRCGKSRPADILLGTLFLFSLLYMITLGFIARTFLWYALFASVFLSIFAGTIFIILALLKQNKKHQPTQFTTVFGFRKILIAAVLFFCLSQIPSVDYWTERLIEVDLPASVLPLALGQYIIKNLTIPAAVSVVFTGYLYLNRRGIL